MCYGDPFYGSDGYAMEFLRAQEEAAYEQRMAEREQCEAAERIFAEYINCAWETVDRQVCWCRGCGKKAADHYSIEHTPECPVTLALGAL